jgi:molecular chaperone GrpE
MYMMSETENKPENLEQPSNNNPSAIPTDAASTAADATAAADAPPTETSDPSGGGAVVDLSQELTEMTAQRDAMQGQYMRIAADFDNFRKRTGKEKEEVEARVKINTITELLAVVDNFERARNQIKPNTDEEMKIHKSYQGVYKQLVDSLKRLGVSPMRPEGQQFDPNLHEAVMRQPTEEFAEGTVIEELQRGYFLDEKILRHALVKVAAPPEQLTAEDAEPSIDG